MMRDPRRIYKVLYKLQEYWSQFPDMRFFQMLQSLEIPEDLKGRDPFFWEDDVWEKIIVDNTKKHLIAKNDSELHI